MKKIVKFGGSSLANAEQFQKVGEIIRSDESRRYVVPSAPGKRFDGDTKVTDLLYKCYNTAVEGEDFVPILQEIKGRYYEIIRGLNLDLSLEDEFVQIEADFKAQAGTDYAASRGEFLNGKVMAAYLGYEFVDAADVIRFDKNGNLDAEKTDRLLSKKLAKCERAVIPGFYGAGEDGKVKTFSRGGSEIDGIEWLRVHYSYPADFPEDVLDQMATNPKVCRYMDIPLQHVADKVLDMMHRHVDGAWTRALIKKMREKVPGIVLRTTMIVGHPGEGVKEFNELLQFVKEAKFERLGAFKYSEEEGTFDALNFKDSVMPRTKQSRLDRLMELQNGISFAFNSSRVGSQVRVIVDDFNDGVFVCRSEFESPEVDGEIMVRYDSSVMTDEPQAYVGGFMNVKIVEAGDYDLVAEFVSL